MLIVVVSTRLRLKNPSRPSTGLAMVELNRRTAMIAVSVPARLVAMNPTGDMPVWPARAQTMAPGKANTIG